MKTLHLARNRRDSDLLKPAESYPQVLRTRTQFFLNVDR
jgi:hypothetical protein